MDTSINATMIMIPSHQTLADKDVAELKRSLPGYKAHLTKLRNKCTELINKVLSENCDDTANYRALMTLKDKTMGRFELVEAVQQLLIDKMTQEANTYTPVTIQSMKDEKKETEDAQDEFLDSVFRLQVLHDKFIRQKEEAAKEAEKDDKRSEMIEFRNKENLQKQLKVPLLTRDNTMSEYQEWKRTFKVFYELNDMDELDEDIQTELFYSRQGPER